MQPFQMVPNPFVDPSMELNNTVSKKVMLEKNFMSRTEVLRRWLKRGCPIDKNNESHLTQKLKKKQKKKSYHLHQNP